MIINEITKLKFELIINNSLYKKNIIDENTYSKANEKLLKLLKAYKTKV